MLKNVLRYFTDARLLLMRSPLCFLVGKPGLSVWNFSISPGSFDSVRCFWQAIAAWRKAIDSALPHRPDGAETRGLSLTHQCIQWIMCVGLVNVHCSFLAGAFFWHTMSRKSFQQTGAIMWLQVSFQKVKQRWADGLS